MQVVYANEPFPVEVISSIFLAGPTPRDKTIASWRPVALAILEQLGYQGHVFVPEPRSGVWSTEPGANRQQIAWEEDGLNRADCLAFWIPRDLAPDTRGLPRMAGLTTNDEFGAWKRSGKCVLGAPDEAVHTAYQKYYAEKLSIPISTRLDDTLKAAIEKVGVGALRRGPECQVPIHIWRTPYFQAWYAAQTNAGNTLKKAEVAWSLTIPDGSTVLWVLDVTIHIKAEDRDKDNEVVIGRTDISTVVLWQRGPTLRDTQVVIVREFRSASRSFDGFVRELPGGSSHEDKSLVETAVSELWEEAGFSVDPMRLVPHPIRQLAATLTCFSAQCFALEVTAAEMSLLKAKMGQTLGVVEDGERTNVEIWKVGDLLDGVVTDWSTLGMIFMALSKAMR